MKWLQLMIEQILTSSNIRNIVENCGEKIQVDIGVERVKAAETF